MKKAISLLLIVMTLCMAIPVSAVSFTDLNSGHWAFAAVSQLVEKGTIKGYTDGSFRPGSTVTRAEFVKMVGEGTEKRAADYNDVPKSHWAYNYVITSGFASDSYNNFYPDQPITRAQTVELLYRRFGKSGVEMPPFVKEEAKKHSIKAEALGWIYTYGILVGDDGVNLRLGDTLTRAEAAALIVKCGTSKAPKNFVDIVSEKVLEDMAKNLGLFGGSYNGTAKVTNADLAVAAAKFANNAEKIDFSKYEIKNKIDHEKSNELYIMLNSNIGLSNFTVSFANKNATVETAEKAIKNAAQRIISGTIVNDAVLYLTGNKDKKDAVTQKEIAALILQYDMLFGSQFAYTTEMFNEKYVKANYKLETDTGKYPNNYKKFAVILKDVPKAVYERPLKGNGTPAEIFGFAREYADFFTAKCAEYVMAAEAVYGAKIKITFFPSLAYENGSGFSFRVKVTSLNSTGVTPAEMFGENAITKANTKLSAGVEFFAEISVDSIV